MILLHVRSAVLLLMGAMLFTACSTSKCGWEDAPQHTLNFRPDDPAFKRIKDHLPGDIVRFPCPEGPGTTKARLLSIEEDPEILVHYVYFNGKEMSKLQIDSLRQVVEQELRRGVPFEQLAERYTMDGNKTGFLDWAPVTRYVPEFSKAVLAHKKGEIFWVDTPSKQWYHVVRKDEDHRVAFKVTVERNY